MVLPVLAVVKFRFLSTTTHPLAPLFTTLLCPFVVKVSCSLRIGGIRQAYSDLLHASRLFFFQLTQIAFDSDHRQAELNDHGRSNNSRWERALRLVYQRVVPESGSATPQSVEDSFHALSMLSL